VAKITPIQESFAAGEITPKLLGRRSIDGYRSGAAEMTNMVADARGPAIGRDGFEFNQSAVGNNARLALLAAGDNSDVMVAFTDLLLTITGIRGPLPSNNKVVNGDFELSGASWTVSAIGGGASVGFVVGTSTINSGVTGRSYIAQQLALAGTGTHTVIVETDGATDYRIRIGTGVDTTTYFEGETNQGRVEFEVNMLVTNPWITIVRDSADIGTNVIQVHRVIVTNDVSQLTFVTPYPESELQNLFFVESPDGGAVYVLHYNYEPYKLKSDGVITFGPVVFTAKPAEWTGTSFPGAGAMFEGRLWLGGTPTSPQTFWGSKSADLENFTLGVNADDALEFTMSQFGAIVWMMGTKNLLIGTINGEHVVSSDGGIITPTDVQIDQQSAYGSTRVQPVQVGDQVFYVSLDATKVRALQYEWSADNWLSKDLTFFSEHITNSGIREMSWSPNPDNILICTLNDGTMAWLSYERGENVWGWHKHVTEGTVLDSTSGVLNGFSYTAIVVQREEGTIYYETLFPRSGHFMDSHVEQINRLATFTVVIGLEHLEGATVQILADGAVAPSQVVVGGIITLLKPANEALVGLQFTPKLVTLPLEGGSPTGSSLAYLKRYNRLIVGMLDSALPLINGVRSPDRTPSTPMDTREPNRTGQVSSYQLGWSEGSVVTIEQDLPLAITVLYIGGELPQDVL
jgi:hypothetical protein